MSARPGLCALTILALAAAVTIGGCTRFGEPGPGRTKKLPPAPSYQNSGASAPAAARRAEIVVIPRRKPPVPARLRVGFGAPAPAVQAPVQVRAQPQRRVASAGTYYVAVKDTLYSISRRFQLPLRSLIDANGLKPPYTLRVGQKLRLPSPRVYVVQKGDTVYGISRRNGVGMSELMRLNGIRPPYTISIGQSLSLPSAVGSSPKAVAATVAPQSNGKARPAQTAKAPSPRPTVKAQKVAVTTGPIPKPPPRQGSKFLWPVRGTVVSDFGPKGKGYHNDGINIVAPRGSGVHAAENGVVAYAGNELRGFGNLVLVRHSGGWTTAYAHNDRILVSRGQTVNRGQRIAEVGSSGNVAEPQLHFEIRKGARAVDPRRLMAPKDARAR